MEIPTDFPPALRQQYVDEEAELERLLAEDTPPGAPPATPPPVRDALPGHETPHPRPADTPAADTPPGAPAAMPTPAQAQDAPSPTGEVPLETSTPPPIPAPDQQDLDEEMSIIRQENVRLAAALRTLKGKTYAEVPRAHQRIRDLEAQIEALRQGGAGGAPPASPPSQAPPNERVRQFVTAFLGGLSDDERDIPPEWLEVTLRAIEAYQGHRAPAGVTPAAGAPPPAPTPTMPPVHAPETRPASATAPDVPRADPMRYAAFIQRLNSAVPDVEQLNADPLFLAWLDMPDPLVGQPRRLLLEDAEDQCDDGAVAAWFNAFKRDLARATGQAQPAPSSPQALLEEQEGIRPVASTPSAPKRKAPLSQDELDRLAVEVTKGRFPEAEYKKLEQQSMQAAFA